MTKKPATRESATIVPEHRRGTFLPTLFGLPLTSKAENTVYDFLKRLSPTDYDGGYWNFYEFREQTPLFLAPASRPHYRIESELTEHRGEVSAEVAGIVATLLALADLTRRYESEFFEQRFYRLLIFSVRHPEAAEIARVTG